MSKIKEKMDSMKLVDSLTKENMNQKKKKRELILLKYRTDSIEKQKGKSIQFNDRKAFEFMQTNKWKRELWTKADTNFRSYFEKQLNSIKKRRQNEFQMYRSNTMILEDLKRIHGAENRDEHLTHFTRHHKTTPDMAHSLYQIQHQQLRISSCSRLSSMQREKSLPQISQEDLIQDEINSRIKTANKKEIDDNKFYSLTRRFIHETSPFQVETKRERTIIEAQRLFREKTMLEESKTTRKKDTRFFDLIDSLESIKVKE